MIIHVHVHVSQCLYMHSELFLLKLLREGLNNRTIVCPSLAFFFVSFTESISDSTDFDFILYLLFFVQDDLLPSCSTSSLCMWARLVLEVITGVLLRMGTVYVAGGCGRECSLLCSPWGAWSRCINGCSPLSMKAWSDGRWVCSPWAHMLSLKHIDCGDKSV